MSWNTSVVTNAGVGLLNESLAGHTLTIERAVGGAGTLEEEALKAAADVADPKQTFHLLGIEDVESGKRVGVQITNQGVAESYILHQIGVKARLEFQEPEEAALLFVLQDGRGVEIPSEAENPDFLFEIYGILTISNNANIEVRVDTGVVASVAYVDQTAAQKADLTLSNLSNYQKALRNLGGRPNRNLLDNWYFAGGGSQQGDGQFPINQRGETSYTSPGYIIDRWKTDSESVTLSADCIKITNANNKEALWWIRQFFEQNRFLVGTTLTVSALVKVSPSTPFNVVLQATHTTSAWSGFTYAPKTGKYELVSYTTTLAETPAENVGFGLVTHSGANTGNADFIEVKALKVEFGPTQTLAYQDEDGNWQLFETPDYGAELAKCQRYFQLYSAAGTRPAKAVDCRPVMRTDPVQSTAVIGETTYYCNNAEL